MKINKDIIKKLNPCEDRYNNYITHYSDFDGDIKDFILLENITYSDKVWVFVRLATPIQNVKWSLLCASKVLSIFETAYPEDKRPRLALEACEAYLYHPNKINANAAADASYAAADASYAAADAASYAAADAAANAASYAAADAASYAAYAAHSIYYTARAAYTATEAAAHAVEATAYAGKIEEEVNLLLMIEALEK